MAKQEQISSRPWILEAVPLLVVILIAAHVLALVIISVLFNYISVLQKFV